MRHNYLGDDGVGLFLPSERREAILADARCVRARYTPGEIIYAPREFDRSLGLVRSGSVRVSKQGLVMSVLDAGDLFGAAALFLAEGEEYAVTLTALTACEVVLLPEAYVRTLVREDSGFAEGYIAYLASRIRFLSARVDALSAGDAAGRLAQFLHANADGAGRVTLPAAELARRIGIGRASLYRAFDALEHSGAICRNGKHITVLNLGGIP